MWFLRKKVVVRIAPSPTGPLHVGTARTALFNYLFAKHNKGSLILRIEDTDKERSKVEFEKDIIEGLSWLQIKYDKLYRQSQRGEIYKSYIQKLIDNGSAYLSKEASKNNPNEQVEVVRLKNQNKKIIFNDLVRGEITFDTTELKDFVIAKNINEPLYHLAVVVDDYEMGITHVIRGEDHISNTPRQILIQEALGFPRPKYAHIPLILAPDKSKLSKRHGAMSISKYKKDFLPEALINYLALLGWNPGVEQEVFRMLELIKQFDIKKIQKGGAVFDIKKLKYFNHLYIKNLDGKSFEEIALPILQNNLKEISDVEVLRKILKILQERIKTFSEINVAAKNKEFDFYFKQPEYDKKLLIPKNKNKKEIIKHLNTVVKNLKVLKKFDKDNIKNSIWDYSTEKGRGNVLWPMRFALTGMKKSPDPFSVAEILGKDETLKRLKTAISYLK